MIDIHTHILPAVDDGAKSFEDSLKMIQLEIENGVDTIILTPHYFKNECSKINTLDDLKNVLNEYKTEYMKRMAE